MRPAVTSFKSCISCHQELAQAQFYVREKGSRWDSVCKECRKAERRFNYQKKIKNKKLLKHETKIIIEPLAREKTFIGTELDETTSLVSNTDFTDMEKNYGLQLSYSERFDSIQRFNEFVSILREGCSEQLGCKVYVKEDK